VRARTVNNGLTLVNDVRIGSHSNNTVNTSRDVLLVQGRAKACEASAGLGFT
jgi:hypothetical protein